MQLLNHVVSTIDALNEGVGRLTSWLVLVMVLSVIFTVITRYFFPSFSTGSVAIQELQWHLFSLTFLLGAAYTFKHDEHVRVDIFYQHRRVTDRQRAWINIFGNLLFLIPFCLLIIFSSWDFVKMSYQFNEGSPDAGGLPYRFLLKIAIPLGFILLMLQGIADTIRQLLYLFGQSTRNLEK